MITLKDGGVSTKRKKRREGNVHNIFDLYTLKINDNYLVVSANFFFLF